MTDEERATMKKRMQFEMLITSIIYDPFTFRLAPNVIITHILQAYDEVTSGKAD
ncbi:MAG: hypothetical protein ACYDHW_07075 [Syntrophorhabdaceae bacterium]